MISDLQNTSTTFSPIDDASAGQVAQRGRRPPQAQPNVAMLIVISLQALIIVALICVTVILGGKIDATQRAITEAKDAAELAQQAATSSAAHVRYISCEVQRTRPRSAVNYFEAPLQCDPPPRDATGPAAAPATPSNQAATIPGPQPAAPGN